MKPTVYADNAATTQLDTTAFEAMRPYLLQEYGNPSQPYALAGSAKQALREARATVAACINAHPEEIYFTSGGTEANNWAIKGTAFAAQLRGTTVTSAFEHRSVLGACRSLAKLGYPTLYIPPNANGSVSPNDVKNGLTPDTRLVSVMMVNNELGTVQPIRELADIAHRQGALFHTDAVAALGHIPVDVEALGVDLLSASAHKFNGPKGVGFLYIKQGTPIAPLMDGGAQEGGYRGGTENVAAIVGMAAALKENCLRMEENGAYVSRLETLLLTQLSTYRVPFTRNGNGTTVPGLLSLAFPGFEGERLLHRLDILGIQVSTGSACDGADTQISHVLRAIQPEEALAKGTIRISLSKHNTAEDVNLIAAALREIVTEN